MTVVCVLSVAMLSACARSPEPTASAKDDEAESMPARPASPAPTIDRVKRAAALQVLIATSPNCERFHQQLEEAGRSTENPTQADDLNRIVASAHDAGCGKKP
jgi:hypothetical protein